MVFGVVGAVFHFQAWPLDRVHASPRPGLFDWSWLRRGESGIPLVRQGLLGNAMFMAASAVAWVAYVALSYGAASFIDRTASSLRKPYSHSGQEALDVARLLRGSVACPLRLASAARRAASSPCRPAPQFVCLVVSDLRQAPEGRRHRLALRYVDQWRGSGRRKARLRQSVDFEEYFAARFDGEAQALGIDRPSRRTSA